MKFAVQVPTTDSDHWLQALEQAPPGFAGYALNCPYPLPDIPVATVKALRTWGEERGWTYFIHTPVGKIKLGSIDPIVRQTSLQEVKRAIDLAAGLGARLITVHSTPCNDHERDSDPEMERLEREALSEICAGAAHHGVTIALENMPPGSIFPHRYSDFSGLLALLKEIAPLGITLDVGHANLAQISLPDMVHQLSHRIRHIHIHDNDGSGDQHLPVGQGAVDWIGFMKALAQIDYEGFLELEFQGYEAQIASKRYLEGLFR
ncbi:MAG: sugar phosphate isomerase/epimerase [Chloroflexi bacterium]|nr:sugar phosphate isomerase/epimerase [Chloroflexota bacterium]